MLKIPADLILLKGGVLVRWSTCLLYILFFSFSHSEVDILLQTQHLNQYMTSKSRCHCDNIKVFNQGKSNQIREKSGKNQRI